MTPRIPGELLTLMKTGKKASVLEVHQITPASCQNCGGMGIVSVFVGVDGPYRSPSVASAPKVCAFIDGRWWVGQHFTASCPVCRGTMSDDGIDRFVPAPAMNRLTNNLRSKYATKRTEEENRLAAQNAADSLAEIEAGEARRQERAAVMDRGERVR